MANATTHTHDREKIPRMLLRAMALLVVVVLLLVTYARLTDRPLEAKPADGPIAMERVLHIIASDGGAAQVLDANGSVIANMADGEGGFVAGAWRAINYQRGLNNLDPALPVRLVRFEDGRLALFDDYTGWRMEIMGFGRDNTAAFARLLN